MGFAPVACWLCLAAPHAPVNVFPSGPEVSEHLLRISLAFARGYSDNVLSHLSLLDADAKPLSDVFLAPELRSPDERLITILLDPGRVKSGLSRHESRGLPLQGLSQVTLAWDSRPIRTWRVRRGPCAPLDTTRVYIVAPEARQSTPLRVTFPVSLDVHARHLIAVADARGVRVAGVAALTEGERTWTLSPQDVWRRGRYTLMLHPELENACGDRADGAFESPVGAPRQAPKPLTFVIDSKT